MPGRRCVPALLTPLAATVLAVGAIATPATAADAPPGPVVVVGIDAAAWSVTDRLPRSVSQLTGLAGRGAVGSMSVRTGQDPTCPVDGWLTVSAGRRAVGPDRGPSGRCPAVPSVVVDPTSVPVVPDAGSGVPDPRSAGRVRGWDQLAQRNAGSPFAARIGSLSAAVSGARSCVTAVGPGAALAAAGPTGDVDSYVADPRSITHDVLTGCAVTIVDAGPSAAAADRVLARVAVLLPPGGTVLVAGVDDAPVGAAGAEGLRVAAAVGPTFPGPGPDGHAALLDTDSTRWPGLVQLTDVAPTALAAAGITDRPATFVGSPWTSTPADATPTGTLARLGTDEVRARVVPDVTPRFYAAFGTAAGLLLIASALPGRRAPRRRVGPLLRAVGLAVAGTPVATRLASLVPWWSASAPAAALAAAVVGWAVVVAVGCWAVARVTAPPGRRSRRAAVLVAAVTVAVVAVDLMLGSPLQRLTVMGLTPLDGGRLNGVGNEIFAATGTATLFCSAALTLSPVRQRTRRWLAMGPAAWPHLPACLLGAIAFAAAGLVLDFTGVAGPLIVCGVGAGLVIASLPPAEAVGSPEAIGRPGDAELVAARARPAAAGGEDSWEPL